MRGGVPKPGEVFEMDSRHYQVISRQMPLVEEWWRYGGKKHAPKISVLELKTN